MRDTDYKKWCDAWEEFFATQDGKQFLANEKTMTYDKITQGYVIQRFNDQGDCVNQEFVAGDVCEYEFDGSPINSEDMPVAGREYYPFNMQQPMWGTEANATNS